MYEREVVNPKANFMERGRLIQGTWHHTPRDVDFLAAHRPYRRFLPGWAGDGRLKEWESFVVQNDRYHLDAFLANLKLFRIVQVTLYDKESGEHFRFRKVLPLSGGKTPKNLYTDSRDSRSRRFLFHTRSQLDAGTIAIDLDIEKHGKFPAFTARFVFDTSILPPVMAAGREGPPFHTCKFLCPVEGDMVWKDKRIVFRSGETTGFFRDSKGYYRYLSSPVWCTAAGFDENKRRCGFSLAGQTGAKTPENSANVFWSGGEAVPLPPVHITMPQGIDEPWVIQDTEGMVDISFTPRFPARSAFNFLVFSAEYQTPLGLFSGFLLNSKAERIQIRSFWGLGEKLLLRV
jgi:hypothetical protein